MRRSLPMLVIFGLILLSDNPTLGAPPDAGQIFREQKSFDPQRLERLPVPEEQDKEAPPGDSGAKVLVKGFRFSGFAGVASDAELQPLVQAAVGHEASLADLQRLVRQVTTYLRDKNYLLARAYLPRQDVTEGIIEIAAIAGQSEGKATLQPDATRRLRDSVLTILADHAIIPGQALQQSPLERATLLMNDLPGISARSTLERGSVPGTTRVLIEASEGPLFSGQLSADNFGNRYTGALRGTTQLSLNDPFGIGDQLRLALTGAEDLFSGTIGYSLPLGSSGLKGGLTYSGLSYELGKELSSLDADGRADTLSLNLSYPHIRSRNFSLWQGFVYEFRNLEDRIGGDRVRDRALQVATSDLTVSSYDRFGGGGLTSFRVGLTVGSLDLGEDAEAVADAVGPETEGRYRKITYSLARLQRLSNELTLFGALSGQWASKNLDSSEKFILGGPAAVRAYPVGEAAGDEGHCLTVELRYDLPVKPSWSDIQLVAFFDAGHITLNEDTWANSVNNADGRNNYWIQGAGAGINLGKASRYAVRASFAHTIGGNPGRSLNGKNADNKDDDSRVWLQGIFWF